MSATHTAILFGCRFFVKNTPGFELAHMRQLCNNYTFTRRLMTREIIVLHINKELLLNSSAYCSTILRKIRVLRDCTYCTLIVFTCYDDHLNKNHMEHRTQCCHACSVKILPRRVRHNNVVSVYSERPYIRNLPSQQSATVFETCFFCATCSTESSGETGTTSCYCLCLFLCCSSTTVVLICAVVLAALQATFVLL